MVMTDPVADFLTRIRNGNMVMHQTVEVPGSKMKLGLAKILKEKGISRILNILKMASKGLLEYTSNTDPTKKKLSQVSKESASLD
jgi:small subunit ribosomal protein S8